MPAIYNETLHDRSGSVLYQNLATTKLSEASTDAIRRLFPSWCELWEYIRDNIDMKAVERWELMDQIYPELAD